MKKILLMFSLLFVLPVSVSALSGSIGLTCDKDKLSSGESTTCSITGNLTDGSASSVEATIVLGNGLELVSVNTDSSWEGTTDNETIEFYTDVNKTGEFNIATFVVKALNVSGVDTSISLNGVALSNSTDYSFTNFDVDPFAIRIPSTDNTLSGLSVRSWPVEGFSPTKTEYELDIEYFVEGTFITATATDENAIITGDNGNIEVDYGRNVYTITCTSESGVPKVYTVVLNRPEVRELTSLKINDSDIELSSGTYRYTYKVENSVTSVNIVATVGDEISFSEGFGSRTVKDLEVGNNEILIKSVDPTGHELVYTIVVNRLDEKGNDVAPKEEKKSGTIDNPKTGVYGASLAVIVLSASAYVVARKKGYIKKI